MKSQLQKDITVFIPSDRTTIWVRAFSILIPDFISADWIPTYTREQNRKAKRILSFIGIDCCACAGKERLAGNCPETGEE